MTKEITQTYRLKIGFSFLLNILIGVALLAFSIFFQLKFGTDSTVIAIALLFAILGLTTIFLTTNYLLKSLDTKIRIDHNKDEFEIETVKKTKMYKLADIVAVDITEQRSIGLYGFDFDFARYTFADGKYCIVTNLMTKEYYLPSGLQPKISKSILPIILGRTNV